MWHNLSVSGSFAPEVVKVLAWYSSSATRQICFNGLDHDFRIHSFRLTWPYQIVEVFVTQAKFLEPSVIVINNNFAFRTTNVFIRPSELWPSSKSQSQIRTRCMFICVAFKSYMGLSNDQLVNAPTITIQTATVATYYPSNYFGHVIYVLQTSTYKNITEYFCWLTVLVSS